MLENNAKGLGQLVSNIPELREKKRVIDMHTNIATALMKQIKDREIDAYFSFEEAIITKSFLVCELLTLHNKTYRLIVESVVGLCTTMPSGHSLAPLSTCT